MTSEEFEYFFDLDELEPFAAGRSAPNQNGQPVARSLVAREPDVARHIDVSALPPHVEAPPLPPLPRAEPDSPPPTDRGRESSPVPAASPAESQPVASARTRVRRLLSVHALGQYVYCPRSAILALEQGDDSEVDEPLPRLDYLPNFDREMIEETLSGALWDLLLTLLVAVGLGLMMVKGVWEANRIWFYPAFFVFVPVMAWIVQLCVIIVRLNLRRQAALRAEAREPDPKLHGITPVNWWSLLKAGFEARNPQRAYRHPELPLEGSPWRVLERGSLRIPVVRAGSTRLGPGTGQVFRKHEIRLAAYGLLQETAGHVTAPYGLIFPTDSVRGLAVPLTPQLRQDALQTLADFESSFRESQAGRADPAPPAERARCLQCRHGVPEPIGRSEIERARKSGLPLLVLESPDVRTFHCACGDRFGSAPPHGTSIRLKLKATVE